jgi:phospholipid transport system transporter-binding protein
MSEDHTLEWTADGGARLTGRLTFGTCAALFAALERHGASTPVDGPVDLAAVEQVDSAGLALLLEWQARQKSAGRRLALVNAPGSLLRLAQLADATELMNLSGREDAAA